MNRNGVRSEAVDLLRDNQSVVSALLVCSTIHGDNVAMPADPPRCTSQVTGAVS